MSSDIYTPFEYPDNLVSFIPSDDYLHGDFLLREISVSSPPDDLLLPLPLQDCPPPQFQEPLVFPAEEESVQRSYSSNCMGTGTPYDSPLFGDECGHGIIRRVYSTGDLWRRIESCSAVVVRAAAERYGAEERKERIQKYRAKRNLRNFNKTIKYACRKTLADSRPRIHGRFARYDYVDSTLDDNAAAPPPPPPPLYHRHHHVDFK